jgi:hypothetical protein
VFIGPFGCVWEKAWGTPGWRLLDIQAGDRVDKEWVGLEHSLKVETMGFLDWMRVGE